MHTFRTSPLGPRLLAGFGTAALLAGIGLASSRPAHTAGGPIPVSVGNIVQNTDADNPAQQPFQIQLYPYSSTSRLSLAPYVVPAGKRLVIEYHSAWLQQYPIGGFGDMFLITTVNGKTVYYNVVPPVASSDPFNQATRIYADSGTTVYTQVEQDIGTGSAGSISLSGHFVDVH